MPMLNGYCWHWLFTKYYLKTFGEAYSFCRFIEINLSKIAFSWYVKHYNRWRCGTAVALDLPKSHNITFSQLVQPIMHQTFSNFKLGNVFRQHIDIC